MFKELSKPFRYKRIALEEPGESRRTTKARAKNQKDTLKRIWAYLSYRKELLITVMFLVIISSGLALLGPFLIGRTIDEYIVTGRSDGLYVMVLALGCIYIVYSAAIWLQNYWMIAISQHTVCTMRTDLFRHLHQLPLPFFDARQHGELMSRVTNDIENVSSTLNSSIIQIVSSILTLLGTITVMIWLSPLLTVITLTIVPLMFFGMKWITKRTGKLFKEQQLNVGALNGFIEETISGQRIVKMFSQEQRVISEFVDKNERLKGSAYWAQAYSGFIPKLMNVLNNASFAMIAGVGGLLALKGIITIGAIVIFTEYARQFTRPLNDLANQFNTLLSAIAGAERVFEILDEEQERESDQTPVQLREIRGEVEFRNVSFSYEADRSTVTSITFHAFAGETVALVGPTGAGKTTIINLLSRFYDIDSGTILLDGHDVTRMKREQLRRHMSFVLQDSFLFQGTIWDNIRYGRLDATDEEVTEAAKQANAYEFIMKLPNGFDTVLTQNGSGISQGQKQLLSIARAMLANPSILILDEATSSIDTVTELHIQEALQRLMKGRTSFVIAHRLNTIQRAEQILVLEDGKIIESGSHESLLVEEGFYYRLVYGQLRSEV